MPNITKPTGLSNIWANGGTKIDPGAAKYNIGWVVQLPPYEYQNFVDNRQDQAIAHFSQHGIPEWDTVTEYQGNLSYAQGSDGVIYKCIQTNTSKDPANPLNNLYWSVAFEVFGSVAAVQAQLTAHITNYQTLAGIGNVAGARTNLSVYSKAESDARFAGLNGNSAQVFSVGVATQPQHAVRLSQVSGLLTQATESVVGVVQIATQGEVEAGTSDTKVVTPLKGSIVYLKKSGNLSGLANVATARTNLGLGTMAVQNVGAFLATTNNLSDVPNKATARANLGLTTTATLAESYFLRVAQNLADVPNKATARTNLGLTTTATTPIESVMLKSDNLAGLTNNDTARVNLGLGGASLFQQDQVLQPSKNLGDLSNAQSARNNLGLGSAATMNAYGTTGNLDFTSSLAAEAGYMTLPNGMKMVYGRFSLGASPGAFQVVNFTTTLNYVISVNITPFNSATDQIGFSGVTGTSMNINKGVQDGVARTGVWQVWGF